MNNILDVLDGEKNIGELRVRPDGLMTLFEARLDRSAGLCRLWLIGKDGSAYLGVPVPEGDALVLRKKISKRDMAAFPETPLFAATHEVRPPAAEKAGSSAETHDAPSAERDGENIRWIPSAMGTYTALHNGVMLTAIPAELRRCPEGVHTATVEGKNCLIFRRVY